MRGSPPRLDELDIDILAALHRLGGKVSTEVLGDVLQRPSRTVRYRLNRLKRSGYLKYVYAMTHDRKVGLGDSIVLLNLAEGVSSLGDIFGQIPMFYIFGSTYGRYNGYVVHMSYPLSRPNTPQTFVKSLREAGVVDDAFLFGINDFHSIAGDPVILDSSGRWHWDWKSWATECHKRVEQGLRESIGLELDVPIAKFDGRDIDILQHLKRDASVTLRELGRVTGLSPSQVNARIKRMEREGIIKGYRWILEDFQSPIHLYIFFQTDGLDSPLLGCLMKIPFPKEIGAETSDKFAVHVKLYPSDLPDFLNALDLVRRNLRSLRIQVTHHRHRGQPGELYTHFDRSANEWAIPVDQYIQEIRHSAEQQS